MECCMSSVAALGFDSSRQQALFECVTRGWQVFFPRFFGDVFTRFLVTWWASGVSPDQMS